MTVEAKGPDTDYRRLLKLYIAHIAECEGVTFIERGVDGATPDEQAALEALETEALEEDAEGWISTSHRLPNDGEPVEVSSFHSIIHAVAHVSDGVWIDEKTGAVLDFWLQAWRPRR